jgi:lipopolysaccharide transport system permease protein
MASRSEGSVVTRLGLATSKRKIIEPSQRWPAPNIGELIDYRGLFFFLVWRDIKVRYAQTVLGAGWAIIQPVMQMIVFTMIFGNFANIPSDGIPYPIFSLSALVPWTYFSTAVSTSSNSLISNPALVTKIYFPRLVIPFAPVLAGLVDFAIAFVILILMMLAFGIVPSVAAVGVVPVAMLAALMTVAGVGCWLSALNIRYRDVKHVTPFLVQIWMYLSPIVYPLSIVPERFQPFYALNPMVGVIETFRAGLLGDRPIPWSMLGISLAAGGVILVTGMLYFRRTESTFADVA